MNAPRYLLVKHVPDIERQEPRNIGIILWTPWGVEGRFIGEKPDHPGEVDGRSIPEFVRSKSTYRQWVTFWRQELAKDAITPIMGGAAVRRGDPAFADTLLLAGKGDYVIEDGGLLFDADPEDEVTAIVDSLYVRLIETVVPVADDVRDPGLDDLCTEAIQRSGINENPNWRKGYVMPCTISPDLSEEFEFTYAYANGEPRRLYQRVPISAKRKHVARKAIHDCAWMFEKARAMKRLAAEKCVALVHVTEEAMAAEPELSKYLKVLASVARVINVEDRDAAVREFTEVQDEPLH